MRGASILPCIAFVLLGCDQNMIDQPKDETYETSALFDNGMVNQTPVDGTVARGDLARERTLARRPELTRALLERGRERFGIYCAPCHGAVGDGRGMVVQRGFPQPPSFHSTRLRGSDARYIVGIISEGKGDMFSYAARVEPADRWAIAAYIKALQLSQRFPVAQLSDAERATLAPAEGERAP